MDVVFAWTCYGTAAAAAATNIPATVSAWKARALGGQGPRFPDPIIAALLGNAAWFTYGWLSGSKEAMWVNGFCGSFQLGYLTTFLALCTDNERRTALKSIAWALLYLGVAVGSRFAPAHGDTQELRKQEEFHKLLCTLAGAAAPVTPLFIAFYHQYEMNVVLQMIPHWLMSCIGLINGLIWTIRGFTLSNAYMAIMNVIAAVCSCISLVLILGVLNQQPEVPEYTDEDDDDDDETYQHQEHTDSLARLRLIYGESEEETYQHQEHTDSLALLRLIYSESEEEIESEDEVDPSAQALDETVHQEIEEESQETVLASSSTSAPATPGETAESSGTVAHSVPAAPGTDTE